jgi:predicted nucleotidyltransferase
LLAVLRAQEAELRARGVETLTLFGSIARGDATGASDVDLAMRPGVGFSAAGSIISAGWTRCAIT